MSLANIINYIPEQLVVNIIKLFTQQENEIEQVTIVEQESSESDYTETHSNLEDADANAAPADVPPADAPPAAAPPADADADVAPIANPEEFMECGMN